MLRRLLLALLASTAAAGTAWACSCISLGPELTTADFFQRADQVFVGLVTARHKTDANANRSLTYDVQVLTPFRGASAGEVLALTTKRSTCGLRMNTGEWWLLFVKDGAMHQCAGPSGRAEERQDIVRELYALQP